MIKRLIRNRNDVQIGLGLRNRPRQGKVITFYRGVKGKGKNFSEREKVMS